jgi:hypothetical protein
MVDWGKQNASAVKEYLGVDPADTKKLTEMSQAQRDHYVEGLATLQKGLGGNTVLSADQYQSVLDHTKALGTTDQVGSSRDLGYLAAAENAGLTATAKEPTSKQQSKGFTPIPRGQIDDHQYQMDLKDWARNNPDVVQEHLGVDATVVLNWDPHNPCGSYKATRSAVAALASDESLAAGGGLSERNKGVVGLGQEALSVTNGAESQARRKFLDSPKAKQVTAQYEL